MSAAEEKKVVMPPYVVNKDISQPASVIVLHHCALKTPINSAVISDKGNSNHALEKCEGVKNKMFVSNWGTNKMSVFNINDLSLIKSFGDEDGELEVPTGMAIFNDTLYVASHDNNSIYMFDVNDYSSLGSFGDEDEDEEGILDEPNYLCVSEKDNRLYVTDKKGIVAFNLTDHSFVRRFGSDLVTPEGICLSPDGSSLYVAEVRKSRVSEVDIVGDKIIRSVGTIGISNGQLKSPNGICLSADGQQLLVSESGNNRISVFKTSDFSFVKHIGSKGSEVNRPIGLYCDVNGTIFVADNNNNRITIFSLTNEQAGGRTIRKNRRIIRKNRRTIKKKKSAISKRHRRQKITRRMK